jgi:hypothetical protein
MGKIVIDKEGWRDIHIEEDFIIPSHVKNQSAFLVREKIMRYINTHPRRIYYYSVEGKDYTVDCKMSKCWLERNMRKVGAAEEDIIEASDICMQFKWFYGKISEHSKKSFGGKSQAGGVLEARSEDLLDLFGRLYSIDEVHRMIVQDWNYSLNKQTLQAFYARNIKEIDRLRDQYASDYSDLSLTKKRGRLDKLSVMFYTYFNKWYKNEALDYSRELRALLEQIKKEVEGEQIIVNVQGQINVDLTIEVNKTLFEAQRRVPINNMILAMVAAKKGIDPTVIMSQLTNSYYKNLTGYGKYEPEKELVHPVDLTYNWNEIQRKHKMKDKSLIIEDVQIVESTGELEKDAEMNTVKMRLLEILEKDKSQNAKRKSGNNKPTLSTKELLSNFKK